MNTKPINELVDDLSFNKSVNDFFSTLTLDQVESINTDLFKSPPSDRFKIWESYSLPMAQIEKKFIQLTKSRIKLAFQQDYESYVDMLINKYKVTQKTYDNFISVIDDILEYCNKPFFEKKFLMWDYSPFSNSCAICDLSSFPFDSNDDVFDFLSKLYPILHSFKSKINFIDGDGSSMRYIKETEKFEITIDKAENIRHRTLNLLHELAHVICFAQDIKNNKDPFIKGKYQLEKDALTIVHSVLRNKYIDLYRAYLIETLFTFRRVLFELELYSNPDQNISKLFASTFNRCFRNANQDVNPTYIIDQKILLRPLSNLPHAIAHGEILKQIIYL